MGKDRVIDKTITPQQAVTSMTPDQVTRAGLGSVAIGVFKGAAAIIDLDKLANQPLAVAEKAYALDRIDARDKVEVTLGAGAAVDSTGRETITVPVGEVWFLNRLVASAPAADGGGAYLAVNFRVSFWPDTATTPDADGKTYWPADKEPKGTPVTLDLPAQGELGEELRLPAGSVINLVATVKTAALAADTTASLTPYGRKGKALVV